jgi:A/G-specific adenine glycosylase
VRRGAIYVAIRSDGAVLLRERPLKGLLGGMLETPSSPWGDQAPNGKAVQLHAPVNAEWRKLPGLVEHTFTHFHLELSVYRAEVGADAALKRAALPERCRWLTLRELSDAALPSLMRKVISHALKEDARPARKRA